MSLLLQIHPDDNVAVARQPIPAGTVLETGTLAADLTAGHKVALRAIPAGQIVRKYGFPIGLAKRDIVAGEHVHEHNASSGLETDTNFAYTQPAPRPSTAASLGAQTFMGYRRPDGTVGVRNEIWIINTVGCVNVPAERIAKAAQEKFVRPGSNIDGVHSFSHPYGCSQLGDDLTHTQAILAGLARHPNAGAVLVLGLGCENNQIKLFLNKIGETAPGRLMFFNAQEVSDEIEEGLVRMEALAKYAGQFKREPIPVTELVLGMKCGGSDGFSGITANPLVGRVSDWLTASGGTAILTEVPEMFGAEQPLFSRCDSAATFESGIKMINEFKDYFRRHNEPIYENPSPGNRAGGITTLEEKSLGCVQKGGRAPVKQIAAYGERAQPGLGGLCLVNAPGNDGVSCTAMVAAGAHVILFTTGRGTPLGVPVPTLKISSNTDLATRKSGWIDFNAGPVLVPGNDIDGIARQLIATVLATASGERRARNEDNGFREITIWKEGVTL